MADTNMWANGARDQFGLVASRIRWLSVSSPRLGNHDGVLHHPYRNDLGSGGNTSFPLASFDVIPPGFRSHRQTPDEVTPHTTPEHGVGVRGFLRIGGQRVQRQWGVE